MKIEVTKADIDLCAELNIPYHHAAFIAAHRTRTDTQAAIMAFGGHQIIKSIGLR